MPLLIDLKLNDKIIINGAVLENAGPSAKLLVHNQAAILRGREILAEEDARTPASRIYFSLQCAYIFPSKQDHYLGLFHTFLADYLAACPSAAPIVETIRSEIARGRIYKALKETHKLLAHEQMLITRFNEANDISVADEDGSAGAPSPTSGEPDA